MIPATTEKRKEPPEQEEVSPKKLKNFIDLTKIADLKTSFEDSPRKRINVIVRVVRVESPEKRTEWTVEDTEGNGKTIMFSWNNSKNGSNFKNYFKVN
jgi:hypothetical protein